ncbi:MAG: hypothetical protein HW411_1657, partial [Gammaproteobacteria bacterium]|nr:hypothetical protein [Gammaproteobacteria bacterium]
TLNFPLLMGHSIDNVIDTEAVGEGGHRYQVAGIIKNLKGVGDN